MLPKKIHILTEDLEILDEETPLTKAWVCINPQEKRTEYTDLSQVWHNASEIPQENHKNIIYQTNYYSMYNVHIDFIPTCLRSCKITQTSWEEFIKENNVKRWAYTDELLPKTEEL